MSDDLRVNWDAVNWNGDQGSYEILRSVDGGSYSQIATVNSGTTYYDDTNLLDGEQYSYKVRAVNSAGSSTSSSASGTTSLSKPTADSLSYVANDQLDFTFTGNDDNATYTVQMSRDGAAYTNPSGGNGSPNSDGTYSYGPNSDNSYDSQVGIDSSFKFRVRAETEHVTTGWNYSSTVYTEPIPPHNPSVSRPDANTVEVTYTVQADQASKSVLFYRKDTGGGYSSWSWTGSIDSHGRGATGQTRTQTFSTSSESWMEEDARYQFKIRSENNDVDPRKDSGFVYADYGNEGNVYFEDDFESGDLGSWDSNNLAGGAGVQSGGGTADLTINGADQGTYYFYGEGKDSTSATYLQKDLGDLSNESDVHVRCAFAVASLDTGAEDFGISWYDGSSWQALEHKLWEYNRQGWFEVHATVPPSYLSTNNHIRVGTTTHSGMYGGDHFAVDRVVVSDILHEYTKPSAPSQANLDTPTEGQITATWNTNSPSFFNDNVRWSEVGGGDDYGGDDGSFTATGLLDGEQYKFAPRSYKYQPRRGGTGPLWITEAGENTAVTQLPAPTGLSASINGNEDVDLSWTVNDNNGSGDIDVERSVNNFSNISTISGGESPNATDYLDTGVTSGTTYQYRIERNTAHASATSSSVSIDVPYPVKVNGEYVYTLTTNGEKVTGITINGTQVL